MQKYLKQAITLVKAQASVRIMQEDEMLSMVKSLALGLRKLHEDENALSADHIDEFVDLSIKSKSAIKERSIICLECGKSFRVITKKHLLSHNLSPDEYREKYAYKRKMPLVCKSLQRNRRKKMNEMKLWERRGTGEQ